MTDTDTSPITPYDRLNWGDDELEALLASGERRRELAAVFGIELYAELAGLARAAKACDAARGPRVWLLPGIMGSRLGCERGAGAPPDTLWLDALDIIGGRLTELALHAGSSVRSLGILQFSYFKLKLQLAAAGYAVRSFDYDWRRGVTELGAQFAAAMRSDARECAIVAHSMGGLVARAALTHDALPSWNRLLLVGTPNGGSWATVQALRGTYSVVRRLAQLDRLHDADVLAAGTFHSFDSLYDLLPGVPGGDLRLLGSDAWPAQGLRPDASALRSAATRAPKLFGGDARCICIAGFGEPTVQAANIDTDFRYDVSFDGDGTVAVDSALLAGGVCYYARSSHSMLTRNAAVAAAAIDLLRDGHTQRLPTSRPQPGAAWRVSDAQLRALPHPRIDWAAMSVDERRVFLDALNQPLPLQT